MEIKFIQENSISRRDSFGCLAMILNLDRLMKGYYEQKISLGALVSIFQNLN
jgi:hypothetical protein